MNSILVTVGCIFLLSFISLSESATDKIVCYYSSWATDRERDDAKLVISDIDGNLCTHIIYSFVGITEDGSIIIFNKAAETTDRELKEFVNLKDKNPNLKLMVAVGGGSFPSSKFSAIASNENTRKNMVNSIVTFIQKYNLDGCDMDWEYPSHEGGNINIDKENFVKLIQELRNNFNPLNLILSAALGPKPYLMRDSYDIPVLSENMDFINLMAYDVHGRWESVTGLNAPLYPRSNEVDTGLSVTQFVTSWLQCVGNSEKLVLGLAFYGVSFTLANPQNNEVGVPSTGVGLPGPYTRGSGSLAYFEICSLIKNDQWTSIWDVVQKTPYAYKNDQWVGYDNLASLQLKIDLAKQYKLGGVMVWAIDQDDHHNICGDGNWPLLKFLNQNIG